MSEFRIDDLNPEQLRAATMGEGPLLTIAGVGTGKTITLAARMAWLVSQGSSLPGSCFSRSRALPHADFPALAYSRINRSWPGTCGNAFMPRMERAEIVVVRAAQGATLFHVGDGVLRTGDRQLLVLDSAYRGSCFPADARYYSARNHGLSSAPCRVGLSAGRENISRAFERLPARLSVWNGLRSSGALSGGRDDDRRPHDDRRRGHDRNVYHDGRRDGSKTRRKSRSKWHDPAGETPHN
jgi:UvrD/REP helicase N-terminal domain